MIHWNSEQDSRLQKNLAFVNDHYDDILEEEELSLLQKTPSIMHLYTVLHILRDLAHMHAWNKCIS